MEASILQETENNLEFLERKSIYDLPTNFFTTLEIVSIQDGTKETLISEPPEIENKEKDLESDKKEIILSCRTCDIPTFDSLDQHHAHYKSEWHKFNLKLKLTGAKTITKQEFEEITSVGELSSDSSEDENNEYNTISQQEKDEDDTGDQPIVKRSSQLLFVTNAGKRFSVWKRVLGGSSEDDVDYAKLIHSLPTKKIITVLISAGGFFAGGVFQEKKCLKHKTIRRYTVRRKQGGSQSTRDNKSGTSAPKSAGASIRRHNETKLREEIAETLQSWKGLIASSSLIFLYAPSSNRSNFIFPGSPLDKQDPRIQRIPFNTKRPTLAEVQRIHQWLTTIQFFKLKEGIKEEEEKEPSSLLETSQTVHSPTSTNEEGTTISDSVVSEPDLMLNAVKEGNLEAIQKLIENEYISPLPSNAEDLISTLYQSIVSNQLEIAKYLIEKKIDLDLQIPKENMWTALHKVSYLGLENLLVLLLNANANPTLKGMDGKNPYDLSKNKNIRNVFRKFAGSNPTLWNWESIGVAPLTDEMEKESEKKKTEKKKKKKVLQVEKHKQKKLEEQKEKEEEMIRLKKEEEEKELKRIELERKKKMESMTDREKRALAAEIRMQGNTRLCDNCSIPLTMIPFERYQFKYCTTKCAQEHKKKIGK